jgi:pyruvate,water dikinase
MIEAGFAVPRAFAVTTEAVTAFMTESGLEDEARAVHDDLAAGARIRAKIEETPLPPAVAEAITRAYAQLCEQTATANVPVAVRSSGVAEDLAGASFAGQYDTYLWIEGADSVLEHVRRCWSGLFADTVLTYRPGGGVGDASMGVVVQQLVQPRAAGVMFTLDPVTGDRSKIVIEGSWGLGEAVVSGEVTPDRYRVDKVTLDVVDRTISEKHVEHLRDGVHDVTDDRRNAPCLEDAHVLELATLAKKIEKHRGAPQDIEWAVDERGGVHVLQVRPETVWSQKQAPSVAAAGKSAVDLVLGSFISGGRLPEPDQ